MYKVHFPVINIDWQKSPVPATDLAEIVFLKFQFLPIESIRLSGPPRAPIYISQAAGGAQDD